MALVGKGGFLHLLDCYERRINPEMMHTYMASNGRRRCLLFMTYILESTRYRAALRLV